MIAEYECCSRVYPDDPDLPPERCPSCNGGLRCLNHPDFIIRSVVA